MSEVGQSERRTQQQVLDFFQDALGYRYLGDWKRREGNRNIEEGLLRDWLGRQGHEERLIERALHKLDQAAVISGSRTLYDANRDVYEKLRYGVDIQPSVQEQTVTVHLIDWKTPENNDFAVAEEVTVVGPNTKRPDIVLYVNGIALGVLELKRSTSAVARGIRQNLDNQKPEFIQPFFSTAQLLLAGNHTEGLRYGLIETPEKFWMEWKEPSELENPLERGLHQLCRKERLLEILHDFIVFDAGVKKTCRHNQFFGVRAAQEYVRRREGGVLWHSQGSGKSLTMVWLAKWIREHIKDARVLIITDRTELDEQIEKVFKGVREQIRRTTSGADLIEFLNVNLDWLGASLIHKFGSSEEGDVEQYLKDLYQHLPKGFQAKGNFFVFVDECHRTQSGRLHKAMKTLLPNAVFIGFTGTPLLKKDKATSAEIFGPFIHTYKFDEAVHDGVVLDLRYEARDIDQQMTSQEKIDEWFERKTQGLTDTARSGLMQRWGNLQKILSSHSRLEKIVKDILWDMATRDRLMSGHGNALLVAGSIYSACRLFQMFERTELEGKCAIVTSYAPSTADISGEATGEGQTEKLDQYEIYRRMLAKHFDEPEDTAAHKVDTFEKQVKKRFIEEPAQMKLLIVVDKLLTGFDAPPATYLYIDKKMQDHGLFQAICRVNRLDTADKEVGYIVDYRDLFNSLKQSFKDYTGDAFDGFDAEDVSGLLENRIEKARERLEEAREAVKALCEPVEPPQGTDEYRRYFVGLSDDPEQIKANEPKRLALYKGVGSLLRAYANLSNEMEEAGFSAAEASEIRSEVQHFEKVRAEIKLASADSVDLKALEPAMRHLLDAYIDAEESQKLSAFDDMTLVEMLLEKGEEAVKDLPESIAKKPEAAAETIENNVRKLLVDESAANPAHYKEMSQLLDDLIRKRREEALEYQEYLRQIVELTQRAKKRENATKYPATIETPAQRALYDNIGEAIGGKSHEDPGSYGGKHVNSTHENLVLSLDEKIRNVKKHNWKGNKFKEQEVRKAIKSVLEEQTQWKDNSALDTVFDLVKNQNDY